MEISLPPELMKRIDEAIELLGYNSREELARCAISRFVDKYPTPKPKAH